MNKMDTIPWVEKYRPKTLCNIVLSDQNKQLFKNIMDQNHFPHLLFYGPPGTGKTTTAINLINDYQLRYCGGLQRQNIQHMNASDERGIDVVRLCVMSFIRSNNFFNAGIKFVILDEVDYMTKNAQQALKYLLQTCTQNVRFCLICNYISKIEESLQNEFICIRFNQLPKPAIYGFMQRISDAEGLGLTQDAIETITAMFSSDIRSMINFIQLNSAVSGGGGGGDIAWDKKIIHKGKMEELDGILRDRGITLAEVKMAIHDMSVQYNIDKKSILLKFVHYLIDREDYTAEMLDMVGEILHHGDIKTETWLEFFICGFRRLVGG